MNIDYKNTEGLLLENPVEEVLIPLNQNWNDSNERLSIIPVGYLKALKIIFTVLLLFILSAFLMVLSVVFIPIAREMGIQMIPSDKSFFTAPIDSVSLSKQYNIALKNNKKLEQKLLTKTPNGGYIVVNTSENRFFLYKNHKLIREGLCSTGSYITLTTETEQKWIFKTPKGEFRIRGKTTSPVWKKPDWAFVEEGLPIPTPNHSSRYEYGTLGDYALSLGYGYLIHGTLYQRFLGKPVTHGCVRLGDDDLKAVYTNLSIDSKVYIF